MINPFAMHKSCLWYSFVNAKDTTFYSRPATVKNLLTDTKRQKPFLTSAFSLIILLSAI
jgi:hypothetical protein